MADEKHAGGRPSKYQDKYAEQVYKLCLLGVTDKDIAHFFDVSEQTVNAWKNDYPEFSESIKNGKEIADANVVKSLYHRAIGYEHPEDQIFQHQGKPVVVPTIKHYPPETAAAIFWLKNRQSRQWRDKIETEISGPNGGPIELAAVQTLSDDQLRQVVDIMEQNKPLLTD